MSMRGPLRLGPIFGVPNFPYAGGQSEKNRFLKSDPRLHGNEWALPPQFENGIVPEDHAYDAN